MSKAFEGSVVINLLEGHSQVPSADEILERYVARYAGRPAGRVEAQPVAAVLPEPEVAVIKAPPVALVEDAPVSYAYAESETQVLFQEPVVDVDLDATRIVEAVGLENDAVAAYETEVFEDVSEQVAAVDSGSPTMSFEAFDIQGDAPVAAVESEPEATRILTIADDVDQPEPTRLIQAVADDVEMSKPTIAFEALSEDEPATTSTIAMVAIDGVEGEGDAAKKKKKKRHR